MCRLPLSMEIKDQFFKFSNFVLKDQHVLKTRKSCVQRVVARISGQK